MPWWLRTSIAVMVGGAAGTMLRYGMNLATRDIAFPMATLAENLLGSLLLGIVVGWALRRRLPDWLQVGVGAGFCGALTTMSALAADAAFLWAHAAGGQAVFYLLVSLAGGLLLAWAGLQLGGRATGPRRERATP